MGTNYYLHLGKRSSIGGGKAQFIQALPSDPHENIPPYVYVIDEYGNEMDYQAFKNLIANDSMNTHFIGTKFS